MFPNLMRKYSKKASADFYRRLMNYWPPFLGAGVSVDYASDDYRHVEVSMKLKWSNRNYVGTHFGGSIYAMTDPFYMLMLINNLGKDFIVWDKAAAIEFKKPGKGRIKAVFKMSEEFVEDVRAKAVKNGKYVFDLPVDVTNEEGQVVATINKTLYVRHKNRQT